MIDPSYIVSTNPTKTLRSTIAEKIEALAWGPDLPDGRHVLYVFSDNDLYTGTGDLAHPTQIYAFAISPAAGLAYKPQALPGPLFPPGRVNKALKEE